MAGNNKVIMAKSGQMISAPDKQSLIFMLSDGWRYEEGLEHGQHDLTQTRMHFAKWNKVFDLSGFKFTRTNEDMFKRAYQMENVSQLISDIDSLKRERGRLSGTMGSFMNPYITWDVKAGANDNYYFTPKPNKNEKSPTAAKVKETDSAIAARKKKELEKSLPYMEKKVAISRKYDSSFAQLIPDSMRSATLQSSVSNIRNLKSLIDMNALTQKLNLENYVKDDVELHRKFTLSFACILLFLIGAPLGAIIRKGGLGMPLVIAVVFFMTFHILNITGEKLAKAGSVAPWAGMWMSTAILMPLAVWLIIAARNDSQVFNKELYLRVWRIISNLVSQLNFLNFKKKISV
jgi:lipopolysaccharide export system permease protein